MTSKPSFSLFSWTACSCKLNNQSSGCRPKCCYNQSEFFSTIIIFMIDHRCHGRVLDRCYISLQETYFINSIKFPSINKKTFNSQNNVVDGKTLGGNVFFPSPGQPDAKFSLKKQNLTHCDFYISQDNREHFPLHSVKGVRYERESTLLIPCITCILRDGKYHG